MSWKEHQQTQTSLAATSFTTTSTLYVLVIVLTFIMIRGVFSTLGMSTSSSTPLADSTAASLNSATANRPSHSQQNNIAIFLDDTKMDDAGSTPPSSPFVANVSSDGADDSENTTRLSAKSPIGREHASPLKMLKSRATPMPSQTPQRAESLRSPRKISSPDKRFPIKVSSPEKPRPAPVAVEISIDDVLRDNEGLTKAIQILEDEDSEVLGDQSIDDTMTSMRGGVDPDETAGVDDTFVSTFSTFSAVPDMTSFAKLGQTPNKYSGPTPRRTLIETPATARRPASVIQNRSFETPRQQRFGTTRDDTNLILDFTDQINGFSGYNPASARTARNSPLKTMDLSWEQTPTVNRNTMSNLLDFDIPPAPTPRSMPSITPRELESLKSNFLSEISSLKASLSGKEAEVNSLKTAVGDAEKRVGESLEQVREERSHKEQLIFEKEEWEKRGREMEAVLRNVKEEIVHGERERDELEGRLQECEGRREAAEMMAQEAESKMAAMRAGKVSPLSESVNSNPDTHKSGECNNCGNKAVEIAVEKVSRELHTLYKEKHESKVAALKKSYEKRWEKRIRELEFQIEDLSKENEELRVGRDNTMTKVEPKNPLEATIDIEKQAAQEAKTKELEAELEGLAQVINSVKQDNSDLRKMLDEERVEKGKLVAAVDEMIPLVAAFDDMLANMDSAPENLTSSTPSSNSTNNRHAPSQVENLRGSISRASGLRAPASVKKNPPTESRIGRGGFGAPAGHERTKSVISQGTSRPGSGLGYTSRSGIMSSIEKMGSYKGRGE